MALLHELMRFFKRSTIRGAKKLELLNEKLTGLPRRFITGDYKIIFYTRLAGI